jgi:hypothetical protein
MDILGVRLDRAGSTACSIEHRIAAAWSMWVGCSEYLTARRIPLLRRIQKFYETIGRTILYGSGGWVLNEWACARLDRVEKSFLRKILCRPKHDDETWASYHVRINHKIREVQARTKIMPLSLQAVCNYYGWAGHVARLDPECPIHKLLCWRPTSWFKRVQDLGSDDAWQRVPRMRVGRPIRWDEGVLDAAGFDWMRQAQDWDGWRHFKLRAALEQWGRWHSPQAKLNCLHSDAVAHISPRISSICAGVPSHISLALLWSTDNAQVANQVTGIWDATGTQFEQEVARSRWLMHAVWAGAKSKRWPGRAEKIIHRPRNTNSAADSCAELALKHGDFVWHSDTKPQLGDMILITSDGSWSESGSSVGACIFVFRGGCSPVLACCAGLRVDAANNVYSEFAAHHCSCMLVGKWLSLRPPATL